MLLYMVKKDFSALARSLCTAIFNKCKKPQGKVASHGARVASQTERLRNPSFARIRRIQWDYELFRMESMKIGPPQKQRN